MDNTAQACDTAGNTHKRNDVFISFHGSESLCSQGRNGCDCGGCDLTMRHLVKTIVNENILQRHWVNGETTQRYGTLGIFLDDKKLTNSPHGFIQKAIVDGLLETRGGGVVAILATPGYFESKWCRFELMAAWKLANTLISDEIPHGEVRFCFIAIRMSVEEASARTAFLGGKFQILQLNAISDSNNCLCCNGEARKKAASEISSLIVSRGDGIVAGTLFYDSLAVLVEDTARQLSKNSIDASRLLKLFGFESIEDRRLLASIRKYFSKFMQLFGVDDDRDRLFSVLSRESVENPRRFLATMRKFLGEREETGILSCCKNKLTTFDNKWRRDMEWDRPRKLLEDLCTSAGIKEVKTDGTVAMQGKASDQIMDFVGRSEHRSTSQQHRKRNAMLAAENEKNGGKKQKVSRDMDGVVDVYFAVQHQRSSLLDNLVGGPQQLADIEQFCDYVNEKDGLDSTVASSDMEDFLTKDYQVYFSDGRTRNLKITLKEISRVRVFVWFAKCVNELNSTLPALVADVFGGNDKAVIDVLVVCMEFGAESTARAIYEIMKDGVGRVVWMCLDPSQNNDAVEIFTKALLPFCARFLPGKESLTDCMTVLEGHWGRYNYHPPNDSTATGNYWKSRDSPPHHDSSTGTLRVDKKQLSSYSSNLFRSRELRQLKVAATDLHFLSPGQKRDSLIDRVAMGESHRCVFLVPHTMATEEMAPGELKMVCARSRALALHALAEIESFISSDHPERRKPIRGFLNGVFRVASKDDKEFAECKLKRKGWHALLWLDFVSDEMAGLFPHAKAIAAWISGFSDSIILSLVFTSNGKHFGLVKTIQIDLEELDDEDDNIPTMEVELFKLPRNTIGAPVPIASLVGSIKILPLEHQEMHNQERRCLLDVSHGCNTIAAELEQALFGGTKHDRNFCSVTSLYRDTDGSVFVGVLLREVKFLTALRDRALGGKAADEFSRKLGVSARAVHFDPNSVASLYESMMLQLETLTDHQQEKLAECKAITKTIHIKAQAGTGKTFLALNSILDYLETSPGSDRQVLFVCSSMSLAFHFCTWLCCRFQGTQQRRKLLERLFVLTTKTSKSSMLCGMEYDAVNELLRETTIQNESSLVFGMIAIDEAHDVFRSNDHLDEEGRSLKGKVSEILEHERNQSAKLMLLSDMSQASAPEDSIELPKRDDLAEVKLNEVCRSSKRILLGSRSFQLGKDTEVARCAHDSDGLPLRALLFPPPKHEHELFENYVTKIGEAIDEVTGQFPGLDLHRRLAIIVPDKVFREALCRKGGPLKKRYGLVPSTAMDASKALPNTRKHPGEESQIIVDMVDEMNGLESLIVFGVGLDQSINDAAVTTAAAAAAAARPRIACSRIYRAITRAQMVFYLINVEIQGGWLTWLRHVRFDKGLSNIDFQYESSELSNDAAIELVEAEERQFNASSNSRQRLTSSNFKDNAKTNSVSEMHGVRVNHDDETERRRRRLAASGVARKMLNRVWRTTTSTNNHIARRHGSGTGQDTVFNPSSKGMYLLDTCEHGSKDAVVELLDRGADIHAKDDEQGNTPLHYASLGGHKDTVCELLDRGADIHAKNNFGSGPLHLASWDGHKDTICDLLDRGADIHAKSNNGWTPLHNASSEGQKDTVCELLDHGADIHAKDNKQGRAPLHLASQWGYKDTVSELLHRGADINAKEKDSKTPLHHASWRGYKDTVCELLDHGADIHAKDNAGQMPLHLASWDGHKDTVCELLDRGADIHAKDNDGIMPVHDACRWGHTDTVCTLLDRGADIHAKDKDGRTPLHWAARERHKDTVCELLRRRVDIHAKDKDGKTPLDLARWRGETDIAEELEKAEANHPLQS